VNKSVIRENQVEGRACWNEKCSMLIIACCKKYKRTLEELVLEVKDFEDMNEKKF